MTFFICLFIVLMQFLWRYVDEMVGKGLEMSVLAELFFYAAVTMVPMALPLAILLASWQNIILEKESPDSNKYKKNNQRPHDLEQRNTRRLYR